MCVYVRVCVYTAMLNILIGSQAKYSVNCNQLVPNEDNLFHLYSSGYNNFFKRLLIGALSME